MSKEYLDVFRDVAARVGPKLAKHELHATVGNAMNSFALKVRKNHWGQQAAGADRPDAGIFFSVWIEHKEPDSNRAFYNIHALYLRNLRAYSLQSREFASAFRARFTEKSGWPEVSVNYGPQTLMQGWFPSDTAEFPKIVERLIHKFIPLSDVLDELLAERRIG